MPRTAEKAQLSMRLPRTITFPARNTLIAFPYCPEPPERFPMFSSRLSMMRVPSSPAIERQTWMPLLPARSIRLRASRSPAESRAKRAASAVCAIVLSLTSPATAMQTIPLRPEPAIVQSAILTALQLSSCTSPRRSGSGRPAPSRTRPRSVTCPAPVPDSNDSPWVRSSRVAPRTPTRCEPVESLS